LFQLAAKPFPSSKFASTGLSPQLPPTLAPKHRTTPMHKGFPHSTPVFTGFRRLQRQGPAGERKVSPKAFTLLCFPGYESPAAEKRQAASKQIRCLIWSRGRTFIHPRTESGCQLGQQDWLPNHTQPCRHRERFTDTQTSMLPGKTRERNVRSKF
jgi:hypothetical protein